eukprot:scaffold9715_cov113-Isochrysis_galbana.AAC.21
MAHAKLVAVAVVKVTSPLEVSACGTSTTAVGTTATPDRARRVLGNGAPDVGVSRHLHLRPPRRGRVACTPRWLPSLARRFPRRTRLASLRLVFA